MKSVWGFLFIFSIVYAFTCIAGNDVTIGAIFLFLAFFSALAYLYCDAVCEGNSYDVKKYNTPIYYHSYDTSYKRTPTKEEYSSVYNKCKRNFDIRVRKNEMEENPPLKLGVKEKKVKFKVTYSNKKVSKKWKIL